MSETTALSREEEELYDRQIRTWGVDAQKRLREARLLFVGLDGCSIECIKNLTLAGIGSLDFWDDCPINDAYCETHWFARLTANEILRSECDDVESSADETRIKSRIIYRNECVEKYFSEMNENVQMKCYLKSPKELTDNFNDHIKLILSYDMIILNQQSHTNLSLILEKKLNDYYAESMKIEQSKPRIMSVYSIARFGLILLDPISDVFSTSDEYTIQQWPKNRNIKHLLSVFYAFKIFLNPSQESTVRKINSILTKKKTTVTKRSIDMEEMDQFLDLLKTATVDGENMISVCPTNALLGGCCANFIMGLIQKSSNTIPFNVVCVDLLKVSVLSALITRKLDSSDDDDESDHTISLSDHASSAAGAGFIELDDSSDDKDNHEDGPSVAEESKMSPSSLVPEPDVEMILLD